MTPIAPDTEPGAPLPAEGDVHVWVADLDAGDLGAAGDYARLLSPEESERASRFARARDASRWRRSRGLLRLLLGRYLGADPAGLRFEAGEHGKPRLAGGDGELRFSMSHSGAIGLYAVALGVEVGIDVERCRRRPHVLAVAERAFGGEVAARLGRLGEAEREREFLRLWVRHEAALKCLGTGLGGGDGDAGGERPWVAELDLGRWAVTAAAAVATMGEPAEVRFWEWPV